MRQVGQIYIVLSGVHFLRICRFNFTDVFWA